MARVVWPFCPHVASQGRWGYVSTFDPPRFGHPQDKSGYVSHFALIWAHETVRLVEQVLMVSNAQADTNCVSHVTTCGPFRRQELFSASFHFLCALGTHITAGFLHAFCPCVGLQDYRGYGATFNSYPAQGMEPICPHVGPQIGKGCVTSLHACGPPRRDW